jgi:hypothetical protein
MKTVLCNCLAVVVALLSMEFAQADQTIPALVGIPPEDPLEVSHIVVRGVVESVTTSQFDLSDGSPGTSPAVFESITAQVRVLETLRGGWTGPDITFVALGDPTSLARGGEYIICGLWNQTRRTFVTGPHIGIFTKDGDDRWIEQPRPTGRSGRVHEPVALTSADVLARLRSGSLDGVTRQSDVIVSGTVVSKHDSDYVIGDGRRGTMTHYRVRVEAVIKGHVTTGHVEFVVPQVNEYVPEWYRFTYPNIELGQEWLVFLRTGDRGLYPFAGRNSLLLIDEERLIYDSIVDYPQTRSETVRRIQSEVERGPR